MRIVKPTVIRNGLSIRWDKDSFRVCLKDLSDEYEVRLDPWQAQKLQWELDRFVTQHKVFYGPGEGWDLPPKGRKY